MPPRFGQGSNRVRVDVTGDADVLRSLLELGAAGKKAAKVVLGEKAAKIMRLAFPLTPDDTTTTNVSRIRDSLAVIRPSVTKSGTVSSGVKAGGGRQDIPALLHHEDLTLHHQVGGPKFLERATLQVAPEIPGALLEALDREAAAAVK